MAEPARGRDQRSTAAGNAHASSAVSATWRRASRRRADGARVRAALRGVVAGGAGRRRSAGGVAGEPAHLAGGLADADAAAQITQSPPAVRARAPSSMRASCRVRAASVVSMVRRSLVHSSSTSPSGSGRDGDGRANLGGVRAARRGGRALDRATASCGGSSSRRRSRRGRGSTRPRRATTWAPMVLRPHGGRNRRRRARSPGRRPPRRQPLWRRDAYVVSAPRILHRRRGARCEVERVVWELDGVTSSRAPEPGLGMTRWRR